MRDCTQDTLIECYKCTKNKMRRTHSDKLIKRFIEKHGGKVTGIFHVEMTIPKFEEFHTKERRNIKVDLYQIEGKTCE